MCDDICNLEEFTQTGCGNCRHQVDAVWTPSYEVKTQSMMSHYNGQGLKQEIK